MNLVVINLLITICSDEIVQSEKVVLTGDQVDGGSAQHSTSLKMGKNAHFETIDIRTATNLTQAFFCT